MFPPSVASVPTNDKVEDGISFGNHSIMVK